MLDIPFPDMDDEAPNIGPVDLSPGTPFHPWEVCQPPDGETVPWTGPEPAPWPIDFSGVSDDAPPIGPLPPVDVIDQLSPFFGQY
jgi:hypothetical protein